MQIEGKYTKYITMDIIITQELLLNNNNQKKFNHFTGNVIPDITKSSHNRSTFLFSNICQQNTTNSVEKIRMLAWLKVLLILMILKC